MPDLPITFAAASISAVLVAALLAMNGAALAQPSVAQYPDTVHVLDSPAGPGSAEPHLARAANGDVVMSWLEPAAAGVALKFAVFADQRWSDPATVAAGENWFVNWADFPSVVPVAGELWAAHWLVRSGDSAYAYDVTVAVSQDAGNSWQDAITPHTDGTQTEHGFVTLFPQGDGVGAIWLDGREMSGGHGGHGGDGAMTLRSAEISAASALARHRVVDPMVCDCCQTDVVVTEAGPIAVYRDRTVGNTRDIAAARFSAGEWHALGTVANDNWQINACPVNGPAIAARGDRVAVAWFTAADGQPRLRVALSGDSAASFSAPLDLDAERPVGRVDTAFLDDGTAVVSWITRTRQGGGAIVAVGVSPEGRLSDRLTIAETATSRPSGFPQMVEQNGVLVVAWTDVSETPSRIQTAVVDPASLRP